ncbi:kojibiose phosphorylase [Clostridium sp. USBA 49]|jgi:kojibiose phosphorylase|uniref:glycoside hydrolase family 65 protein n=1 Tax=Clostridium TaxID=1485 RepID=UPI00099A9557|nr:MULTISPECIES: glycosyl hydrolase family 65 protein [Clostridium]SKA78172.1 kojibiose phosphorylase [Clostridium sp. USBA 49]
MDLLWEIVQDKYNSRENRKYETLFTLANGYKGLRGALEFSKLGERGNFIAGIFDKNTAQVTEIVNCQDILGFNLYIEEELVDLDICEILNFTRKLNMKEGILSFQFEIKTPKGKIIKVASERFVSRNNVHRWAAKYLITPINFNGKILIENIIDGTITNNTLDPINTTKHFNVEELIDLKPGIALITSTIDKKIKIMEGTSLIGLNEEGNFLKERKFNKFGEKVRELYQIFAVKDNEYTIYKLGATYTSRDINCSIKEAFEKELKDFIYDGYEKEKDAHIKIWEKIWTNIDIKIKGDDLAQQGIRFNLFHLSSSAYEGDDKISIAAKGLHGEGYKGHVFWDTETFMLPFFIYTSPETAKALLMYRYNTLEGARKNAMLNGFKGAQFPWESADEGVEVTPKWGIDYLGNPVRIWTGDEEFHINSDITFAIWEYYRATNDEDFLKNYGLEIFLDTAKFWQSRVEYNKLKDRYEINNVIGPDEFHEHVNNNVYTNYLAKWSIKKSLELVEWIKNKDMSFFNNICIKLGLNNEDFKIWQDIQEKMYIPKSKDGRIIEQFEGYFDLKYIKITEYDENGMPVWPKDVELDKLGETQLIKQPDVIMLMLMLREEFDEDVRRENYKYYEERTMHKSSLSPSMYSIMGLSVGDSNNAYRYFIKAIMTDLNDNQGNTELGIHAANTGGAWQSVVFGFGGLSVDKDQRLNFNPWIPKQWNELSFNINWRKNIIKVTIKEDEVLFEASEPVEILVYNKCCKLEKDKVLSVKR